MPEKVEEYIKSRELNLWSPKDYFEVYRYAGQLSSKVWSKDYKHAETYLHDFPEQHRRIDWVISMLYGSVLDVGCGEGMLTNFTVAQPYVDKRRIVGVEPSFDLLSFASHWHTPSHWVRSLGEHLPFRDEFFDCVVAAELIEHVIEPDVLIEECRRVLKPMGLIVLTTPLDEREWSVAATLPNPLHLREYSEEKAMDLLSSHGFKTITIRSGELGEPFKYTYHTPEGWRERICQTRMTFIYATGVKL